MKTRLFIPLLAMFAMLAVLFGSSAAARADEFLDPEVAFKYSSRVLDAKTLEISFKIADGYYLYREKFRFSAEPASVKLGAPQFPAGHIKDDEFFGKVETYRGDIKIRVPVDAGSAGTLKLKTVYQGCADAGICYPPLDRTSDFSMLAANGGGGSTGGISGTAAGTATGNGGSSGGSLAALLAKPATPGMSTPASGAPRIDVPAVPLAQKTVPATAAPSQAVEAPVTTPKATPVATAMAPSPAAGKAAAPDNEQSSVLALLKGGNFWAIIAGFLGLGLLLAFTPCVLPMIPIISGIIVGEGSALTRSRSFLLSLSYVLGMAITYTAAGIAAGLSGSLLSNALQNIWVLGAFALIFVALAFSMFGFYELQLPTSWQNKLADTSNRFGGGKMSGTFFMGALSAVIVGPCVAAPLAGALLYIGQTHDVLLGGSALFALAIGMGVPLLLVGLSAGTLLPKAGAWMNSVKNFFGVMLLALAIWVVAPVLPTIAVMLAAAALLIVCAIFLNAIDSLPPHARGAHRFWKGVGVIALVTGVALLIGALSGSRDMLQPLSALRMAGQAQSAAPAAAASFERVKSLAELNQRVASANKPVMLDFYADWCVSCKEMERYTFTDQQVQGKFAGMLLLQADVTANNAEDKELLKRFGLYGPPGIIFFDHRGSELSDARVIGYQPAENFLKTLNYVTGS